MKALVLLSGGQDSTTCLAIALDKYPGQVIAIAFDYGQRHKIELEQAAIIAKLAKVPFEILDATCLTSLSHNALTDSKMDIVHELGQLPSTFVPGRNLFFLSMAAVYAQQRGIEILYTGVCETDFSGYPDCRLDFVQALNRALNLALDTEIYIETPLMDLTKAQTVLVMESLGKLAWYEFTHTCYEGVRPACGKCPACVLRLKGFVDSGRIDPLSYQN